MKKHYQQISYDIRRSLTLLVLLAFTLNGSMPAYAQGAFVLPIPGAQVPLSPAAQPLILKAVKINPENPFQFEFIVDQGNSTFQDEELKIESQKLIRYFLASLATPENDMWVNLSPAEKDRIIPNSFGVTEMGRDLLAQDYLLKQITATLMYPEGEVGKKFWERVHKKAYEKFGVSDIPTNTFNKVWVVPLKAVVYENGPTAYVGETRLRVMLEEDYLTFDKSKTNDKKPIVGVDPNTIASQVIREIILPELQQEVNEGQNFAPLRQVYNSLILANWYKKRLKDSILAQIYVDKNKVTGVGYASSVIARSLQDDAAISKTEIASPLARNEVNMIFAQYVEAFKKGVYSYIKEDFDPVTEEMIPRKYFSGGMGFVSSSAVMNYRQGLPTDVRSSSQALRLRQVDVYIEISSQGQNVPVFTGGKGGFQDPGKEEFYENAFREIQQAYRTMPWTTEISEETKPDFIQSLNARGSFVEFDNYEEVVQVLIDLRKVIESGGRVSDDYIQSLRAIENSIRERNSQLSDDEIDSRRFTSDFQEVLIVLGLNDLDELLTFLEVESSRIGSTAELPKWTLIGFWSKLIWSSESPKEQTRRLNVHYVELTSRPAALLDETLHNLSSSTVVEVIEPSLQLAIPKNYYFLFQDFLAENSIKASDSWAEFSKVNANTTRGMRLSEMDQQLLQDLTPEAMLNNIDGNPIDLMKEIVFYLEAIQVDLWQTPGDIVLSVQLTRAKRIYRELFNVVSITNKIESTQFAQSFELFIQGRSDEIDISLMREVVVTIEGLKAQSVMPASTAVVKGEENVGGIDLSADKTNLDIRSQGAPIEFQFSPEQLQNLKIDGLIPVIINIAPVYNLPLFLTENKNAPLESQSSKVN